MDDIQETAERVAGELAEQIAAAAGRIGALIPDVPARMVGRLGDSRDPLPAEPAWRGLLHSSAHRDAPELMAPTDRVGALPTTVAHRLLGALENAVRELEIPVPDATARVLGQAATAGRDETVERFGFVAVDERFNAFAMPTQLAGLRAPRAEPLTVALVLALATTTPVAAFLTVGPGPIPEMAAEHGRRYLAVAVAASALVVRAAARAAVPACPDGAEAVTGVAMEVVTRVLAVRPMPSAWADARHQEHRQGYLLPRASAVRLRAQNGRFALTEGEDVPEAGPGRVTAVPGGIVVRTGHPDAPVELTVEVLERAPGEPGEQLRDWDEVVELGYTAVVGGASVTGAAGSVWPENEFGLTFPWPGSVRVRVHARDGGAGAERYLLQLWEAEPATEVVHLRRDLDRLALPWFDADTPVILRTDFRDATAWQAVRSALVARSDTVVFLDVVDDERFADVTPEHLLELAGPEWSALHGELYVVDRTTLSSPQMPVLVINMLEPRYDGDDDRGRSFRATPGSVWDIVANLSIANLSFHDYADWAGPDGVLDTSAP